MGFDDGGLGSNGMDSLGDELELLSEAKLHALLRSMRLVLSEETS